MATEKTGNGYPTEPVVRGELPDPFVHPGGRRIETPEEWPACSRAWRDLAVEMEYGGLPPAPDGIEAETLCHSSARGLPGGAEPLVVPGALPRRRASLQFQCAHPLPERRGAVPGNRRRGRVLVVRIGRRCRTGGGERLRPGDVQPDGKWPRTSATGGFRTRRNGAAGSTICTPAGSSVPWPPGPGDITACVDLLQGLPFIDADRIAVTGHSRGAKAALVAGASDDRIALVNDNASCAAGSPPFRYVGDGGETLDIVDAFPSWFGPGLRPFPGREEEIPFDQHCLLAAICTPPAVADLRPGRPLVEPGGDGAVRVGGGRGLPLPRGAGRHRLPPSEGGPCARPRGLGGPARLSSPGNGRAGNPGRATTAIPTATCSRRSHGRPPMPEITRVGRGERHGAAPGALPCRPGSLSSKPAWTNRKPGGFSL